MSDSDSGHPIQVALVVLLLVGGGWYFFNHYKIDGLDQVSVYPKDEIADDTYISYQDAPLSLGSVSPQTASVVGYPQAAENPFTFTRASNQSSSLETDSNPRPIYRNVKIASWAMDGFGPTKLASGIVQKNLARVIRQFDVVALQQIASIERDLVPRMVELINQGDRRYDFVMGQSTGPKNRQEQLAFIFDTTRLQVDRRQTYTLEDPANQIAFDPLVAWFRSVGPPSSQAWTFSLVNFRIDLARAPSEVALLRETLSAIRGDGRGEDDVVLAGLFQADDAYLVPSLGGDHFKAAVRTHPTDIFGRYQTCNIMMDSQSTTEFLGRGGVYDYQRVHDLTLSEAESVTSHLPVYAEFTAWEGGRLQ